jgi:hypothetical protein
MKSFTLSLIALLAAVSLAQAVPTLSVDKAASLAQKELVGRGLADHVYVLSLVMRLDGALNKDWYWYASWSESIPGDNRTKEVGMRINMDGSTIRVVEGPGSVDALRNPRTRSDRPSILDLKH